MRAFVGIVFTLLESCRSHGAPTPSPQPSVSPPLSAAEELDRLDQRNPVPLVPTMANHQKQNMREHLEVVQEVVNATACHDFARAAAAARRIAYSEQMGRMCEHMGSAAPGFTEQALAFHHSADSIVEAARWEDSTGVLNALGETLGRCTSCHTTYKQKIVAQVD